ncbi:MAG: hypothetical protein HRT68_11040 [Flavobacteriaceae bacterium]|nr:hypothetical protein [Flavobacteriaceae bacterium]
MFFEEEFKITDHIIGEMLRVLLKRLLIMSTRISKEYLFDPDSSGEDLDIL